jgi:predicted DNA-binding mobile mystery protein A
MKQKNDIFFVRQLDKKLDTFKILKNNLPTNGWINLIRKTLKMSLRQLGNRMSITPQSLKEIEEREKEGSISLKTLKDAANALEMELVYGFIPKEDSLEKVIERRAHEMAKKIVSRTSVSMKLEDQENSKARQKEAVEELAGELKRELAKSLWD